LSGFALLTTKSLFANTSVIHQLEQGTVVTTRMGSSFTVEALIEQDPDRVAEAIFENLNKLPEVFSNVAFAKPIQVKEDDGTERSLVYLKLRGLGDGLGVLMEVKAGSMGSAESK